MRRTCGFLLVSVFFFGCSEDTTDFDNPDHVREWANDVSPGALVLPAQGTLLTVINGEEFGADGCPTVEDDGTTVIVTGNDCVTPDNAIWRGSVTIVRNGNRYEATFDQWDVGAATSEIIESLTGSFSVEVLPDETYHFDADYKTEGLISRQVEYTGRIVGNIDGMLLGNGSGTITRSGFTDASGTVTATTIDQLRDGNQCDNESLSGTTTIVHGNRTLTIEYDGATDCDDESSARYSVDGEDRGTIDGITCSASWGRSAPWALLLPLGAAALLALRRRRKG